MSNKRSSFPPPSSASGKKSRKVLVLRYTFDNSDFLMKRNFYRSDHLAYLRQESTLNGGNVDFKVAESLNEKSLYWYPGVKHDEIKKFVEDDPWFRAGVIKSWKIFSNCIE